MVSTRKLEKGMKTEMVPLLAVAVWFGDWLSHG